MELYGFGCQVFHQIEDQLLMKSAVVMAGVEDMIAIYEQDLAGLVCDNADGKSPCFGAGKSSAKRSDGYISESMLLFP